MTQITFQLLKELLWRLRKLRKKFFEISLIYFLDEHRPLKIKEILNLIGFNTKEKMASFNKNFKKNNIQLLDYFLEKYSSETNIDHLEIEE